MLRAHRDRPGIARRCAASVIVLGILVSCCAAAGAAAAATDPAVPGAAYVSAGTAGANGITSASPAPGTSLRSFSTREKVALGALALTLGVVDRANFLVPDTCRWCAPNGLDDFFRDRVRRLSYEQRRTAARLSDVTGFGAVPLLIGFNALAAHDGNHQEIEANSLVIVESAVLAMGLSEITKRITARERPVRRNPDRRESPQPDDSMSFYSGHTTLGFAVAVAAGRVADIEGYRAAPAIWASGLSLAAATGYFRMAADKHYFTDVLAGAVAGSAVGLLVANHHRAHVTPSQTGSTIHFSIRTDGQSLAVVFH